MPVPRKSLKRDHPDAFAAKLTRAPYMLGMVATIAGAIIVIEILVMLVLPGYSQIPGWALPYVDAAAVTILLSPILWFVIVRKLVADIREAQGEAQASQDRLRRELANTELRSEIVRGMAICETEAEAFDLVGASVGRVLPGFEGQLMLPDADHARLITVVGLAAGAKGFCPVSAPGDCPAIRSGTDLVFADVGAPDACPKLRRLGRDVGAMCFPVSIPGGMAGVLHVVGPAEEVSDPGHARELSLLRSALANRIGMLRALSDSMLQASIDPLTGLMNRRSLAACARDLDRSGSQYVVITLDGDHFKDINDRFGHLAGDKCLQLAAESLRAAMRLGDWLSRVGGDEFVVLLPHQRLDRVPAIFNRLTKHLGEALAVANAPRFTLSGGAAERAGGHSFASVLAAADAALYRAKHLGRARLELAEPRAGGAAAAEPERPLGQVAGPGPDAGGSDDGTETPARAGPGDSRSSGWTPAAGAGGLGRPGPDSISQLPGPRPESGASLRRQDH